ncbi:hypothetical protein [uncultured Jatrophihabitans sp.]|uniref:hypothetical protein n=1 Tax=uncultured Jatrophihabitans sp. TaxID=1610747 RepID=UPI0035CA73CD
MPKTDLVLEGGGVKGAGLVGAVTAMTEYADPYQFQRIARRGRDQRTSPRAHAGPHQ